MIMETSELDSNGFSLSLEREKWGGHEFLYKFHGFWFPLLYLESTKKVVEGFKPMPTDVIFASFPKSGTTWLKALLHCITHRSPNDQKALMFNHPQELTLSLESNLYLHGKAPEEATHKGHREGKILATHLAYQMLGDVLNSCGCKVVYLTRNPKDVLISLWLFVQTAQVYGEDPWDLEAAVDHFCRGVIPFGPYYDHVLAYREEHLKRPEKVFFVTYEELKEDPKKHVKRLAEFLGRPFEGEIGEVEAEEIVKMCSFETLSNLEVNSSSEMPEGFPMPYSSFFRKAEVGDHKNYLTDEMIQRIDAITRERFHGNGFMYGL